MAREDSPHIIGDFWLDKRRDGRSPDIWQITWYDPGTRSILYRSTKRRDVEQAKGIIDAHYLREKAKRHQEVEEAMTDPAKVAEVAAGSRILQGCCLDLLPSIPDQSVDMVLADLPYGTTRCAWDSQIDLQRLWPEYRRVCKGAIVLFAQTPFDKVLGASNLRDLRYEWIWEKTHATGHLNAKRAPMKAHENILVFYRSQPVYNPQVTSGHARKVATKHGDGSPLYGVQKIDGQQYDSTRRYPRSVQVFASDKQLSNLHPTQKPVALCEYLIRTYTNAGDIVLDNCMGSGTTGVACLNSGRKFIGIEKSPDIFEIARSRLQFGFGEAV